jgi:hypothetical protein
VYRTVSGKHRPQERATKQFQVERASRSFQGGEEEVERGTDKNMTTTAHQCKDPSNHSNHCNIDGHTEEKCWKLHLELNMKNHKKDAKKKNLLITDTSNQVESNSDVDEKIVCTLVQTKVNLSSLHH